MKGLSASMQNYIKAIYELSSGGVGARVVDIADKLGLTKASVCVAMRNLQEKELVYRDGHRLVHLTEAGKRQAILTLDKFAIVRQFLVEVLGVQPTTADADASTIEHVISVDTLCALCHFVNQNCSGCQIKTDDATIKDKTL